MKKILIFSGTTEGRELSVMLAEAQIPAVVCVATEYGDIVMPELEGIKIHKGRMDEGQMTAFMKEENYLAVVDATHPFATAVSENIKTSAEKSGLTYIRLQRNTKQTEEQCFLDSAACAEALEQTEGNILLTTGSKELAVFCKNENLRERLYARVLPGKESISLCEQAGIRGKQIIAMQGPFSEEMNIALLHQYQIQYMVTKESGRAGGYFEKISAAKKAGVKVYVIGNPEREKGLTFDDTVLKLENMTSKKIMKTKSLEISLIGIGMGNRGNCTVEGLSKIEEADYIFGAERMIQSVNTWGNLKSAGRQYPYYLAKDILPVIDQALSLYDKSSPLKIAVLFSGDSGFYSGCAKLYKKFQEHFAQQEVEIKNYSGISSVSYFASKCGISWNDAFIMSIHGKGDQNNWQGEVTEAVRYHQKTIMIVSGAEDIRTTGEILENTGLGDCKITLGYQLSYPEESIQNVSPKQCQDITSQGLYIMGIFNENAKDKYLAPKYKDIEFIRGKIPMSKEEIRTVSISKLQLQKNAVVYDIGSGTGSIAVEAAQRSGTIKVFAIERKAEGVSLIKENKKKFGLSNIEVIEGKAPDILADLPKPTHAFIGGSGGKLMEIIEVLRKKNPEIRIVITAVSMETIAELTEILQKEDPVEEEIVQIHVSRSEKAGKYHLMRAENPVYIGSFKFSQKESVEE